MKRKNATTLFLALALGVGLFSVTSANAALTLNPGGWGVYDSDLNITWLSNANLAATNTFGVSGINAAGWMTWNTAQSWIGAMNAANYLGYNDWRLPTMTDSGTPGCNFTFSGTDCGYNVNTATSEMAHLWYVELGNKGYADTSGNSPQPGWGLSNTGPFNNVQPNAYWFGTEDALHTHSAWGFSAGIGGQVVHYKGNNLFAWAVRDGGGTPVSAVPEPETYAMLLAGLGLMGFTARRRKNRAA